jgi:hypothetical protein
MLIRAFDDPYQNSAMIIRKRPPSKYKKIASFGARKSVFQPLDALSANRWVGKKALSSEQ